MATMDLTAPAVTSPARPAAPLAVAPGDVAGARKAGEEFTALFFSQTLESLFANMGADKLFGGGAAEDVYRGLMTQEYGKVVARSGGLGIAEAVQREILHLQETA